MRQCGPNNGPPCESCKRWLAARGGPFAVGETVLIRAVGEAKAEELQDGHGGKVVNLN